MENNKNVLDFLSDDKDKSIKINNKPNNNNFGNYLIISIVIIFIGIFIFNFLLKKDSNNKKNNGNSNNDITQNSSIYGDNIDYKINVNWFDNKFFVNQIVSVDLKEGVDSVSFKVPLYYNGVMANISEIYMKKDNTKTSISDDIYYKYLKFEKIDDEIIGSQSFEFSYMIDYPNLRLDEVEFYFLEAKEYDINNLEISLKLDDYDYKYYRYIFSPYMDCSNTSNEIICKKDKLNSGTKVSVKFEEKEMTENDDYNNKIIYLFSN